MIVNHILARKIVKNNRNKSRKNVIVNSIGLILDNKLNLR